MGEVSVSSGIGPRLIWLSLAGIKPRFAAGSSASFTTLCRRTRESAPRKREVALLTDLSRSLEGSLTAGPELLALLRRSV